MLFEATILLDTPRLFLTLFSMGLGAALHIMLLNRVMNYLPDGTYKPILVLATFLALVGGIGYTSYTSQGPYWEAIVMGVAGCVGLGELRRVWLRRRLRGAPPVERSGPSGSFLRPVTTTDLQIVRYEVDLPGWQGETLRVAQLSDLHVNADIPLDYYLQAVEQVNRAQPDLILLTGDFVTDLHFLSLLPSILGGLKSRLGSYAILGNHDYWADAGQVAEMVESLGIHLLRDGWQRVLVDERTTLVLFGCEAPWSKNTCQKPALQAGELALGLSHTADHIYRLSGPGIAAVFSGHYHAGQFRLPFFGPVLAPSAYGRRFDRGHFVYRGTHLFVSAGVAAAHPAFRLYCPPDLLIVDFRAVAARR